MCTKQNVREKYRKNGAECDLKIGAIAMHPCASENQ